MTKANENTTVLTFRRSLNSTFGTYSSLSYKCDDVIVLWHVDCCVLIRKELLDLMF